MKRFIVCIWFGLVFSFLYGAAVSFDDMRERIAYDPLGSLASLDSLETDSTYFSYQIDLFTGFVLSVAITILYVRVLCPACV